jgi:flavin-dependent dehydrogenase
MQNYDVIVIGGGPAGSSIATRLVQRGRRVVVLERERFPRFHIGESLLPCSMPLFAELGVLPALERANFLPKYAAEFVTADGSLQRRYPFCAGVVPSAPSAFEVERAEFDKLLLDHARSSGAEVRQGIEVVAFDTDGGGVEVQTRGENGVGERLNARVLVDASGQRSLLASRLNLRQMDADLKNFAVFCHYRGAKRARGEREGDITIVLVPDGWWWVIPLKDDKTSVGLVAPSRALRGRKPDETYLLEQIAATPYLADRLAAAERIAPVRTISDYSYVSRRFAGDRWLLVGDAAAFIDPVFSTGVYLGMVGAFRAADAIDRALVKGDTRRAAFIGYERWLGRAVGAYRAFVKGFYAPEFAEVLMQPSDFLRLREAVTSLLAGHAVDSFDVTWRIWVFRTIALLNKHFQLTPRLAGRREAALELSTTG